MLLRCLSDVCGCGAMGSVWSRAAPAEKSRRHAMRVGATVASSSSSSNTEREREELCCYTAVMRAYRLVYWTGYGCVGRCVSTVILTVGRGPVYAAACGPPSALVSWSSHRRY